MITSLTFKTREEALSLFGAEVIKIAHWSPPNLTLCTGQPLSPPRLPYTESLYRLRGRWNPETDEVTWQYTPD